MLQPNPTIGVGDLVIIYEDFKTSKAVYVAAGSVHRNKFGSFPHDKMVGRRFGDKMSSHNGHGSFLPHGAVFKVTRDILEVGDVRAHDLSALELQNAESKRVFERGGSRHLEFSKEGTTHKKGSDGEYRLIATKGYGSTAATSTLTKMLATSQLRAGDGMFSTPESRRSERLFGEKATGRSKAIKLECLQCQECEGEYDPAQDSCLDAFMRMLAARASAGVRGSGGPGASNAV